MMSADPVWASAVSLLRRFRYDPWVISTSLDRFEVKARILHMNTFFIQVVYHVMIHCTMKEDLLSHQGLL